MRRRANGGESVIARRPRQQAEGQQQRERAETRHHEIDVAGFGVAGFAVVRHDKRPRRQRHEFPAQQIGERIIRQHHQIHAGEKGREERKHAVRRRIVAAVAETVKAGRRTPQIDDNKEERRQRIHAEMRAKPWQSDWQHQIAGRSSMAEQRPHGADQCNGGQRQRGTIDDGSGCPEAADNDGQNRQSKQSGDTDHLQEDGRHYVRALVLPDVLLSGRVPGRGLAQPAIAFSRTPRPCDWLAAPSSIISTPAASNAAISLTSESTLPRTIVSLDSMR